jgi:VWFA-related protein
MQKEEKSCASTAKGVTSMIRPFFVRATPALLIAFSAISAAQTPSSASSASAAAASKSGPVFHSESRLVVVDVVVTDNRGKPVTGLTKADCTVLEDGKPQQIRVFEPRVPPVQPKAAAKIDLPPNQYTNFPTRPSSSSVNVVLFDVLNTPTDDQLYARAQMVQFLKTLPRGEQVALFQLNEKLHMISGFTTESDVLIAAANKVLPSHSALLDTAEEKQAVEDQTTQAEQFAQPPPNPGADAGLSNRPGAGLGAPSAFDLMREFMDEEQIVRSQARSQITLEAFAELARAVSGYPGRKNVLWLSEGFPITFGVSPDSDTRNIQNNLDLVRQTSGLLSSSQISVYPVDVRGLKTTGVSITGSGASLTGYRGGKNRYGSMVSSQELELQNVHDAMNDIAEQTGGEAFFNTNDLKLAMSQSIERGSTYYTLAYTPTNTDWDSKYRRIEIKLPHSLKADYRRGYFATPDLPSPEEQSHDRLVASMQPTAPVSTMLLLRVQMLPPDAKNPKVRIDYGVYAPDLAFADGPGNSKQGKIEFVALAWGKDGQSAGNAAETLDLSLKPEHYEAIMKNGLSAHLEFEVKPGNYTLRLGVMDHGNGKIGTLDIPLSVSSNVSAESPASAPRPHS